MNLAAHFLIKRNPLTNKNYLLLLLTLIVIQSHGWCRPSGLVVPSETPQGARNMQVGCLALRKMRQFSVRPPKVGRSPDDSSYGASGQLKLSAWRRRIKDWGPV